MYIVLSCFFTASLTRYCDIPVKQGYEYTFHGPLYIMHNCKYSCPWESAIGTWWMDCTRLKLFKVLTTPTHLLEPTQTSLVRMVHVFMFAHHFNVHSVSLLENECTCSCRILQIHYFNLTKYWYKIPQSFQLLVSK